MKAQSFTGIILAGGKSSRMGQDKAFLSLNDKLFIEGKIEILKGVTNNIIIIANKKDYDRFGYPVYKDLIPDCGPLGGILTALHYSQTSGNLILGCDMPCLSVELLKYLIAQSKGYQLTVCQHQQKTEPLVGFYQTSCLPIIKELVQTHQLRLREALKKFDTHYLEIDESLPFYKKDLFRNVNTPEEHQSLINSLKKGF